MALATYRCRDRSERGWSVVFLEGRGAVRGALAAVEEVPHLDDVALGILDVRGAVAAGVLLRPMNRSAVRAQPLHERVERARARGEREVHVAAALVAELLLARRPDAEPRVRPRRQPDPVVLALQHLEAERRRVEPLERRHVARLEGQLRESTQ